MRIDSPTSTHALFSVRYLLRNMCGCPDRKPYAIRHSAISHALANGANPIALAEQTGHDKRVLLDTYAHAIAKEYLFMEV